MDYTTHDSDHEPWPNVHDDVCDECGDDDVNFYGVEPQYAKCNGCGNQWAKDYSVARNAGNAVRANRGPNHSRGDK